MSISILALIVIYGAIVLVISFTTRKYKTSDEYLMGGRNATSAYVGSALFTLVGGGELITLTALSFVYGWAGLALFVGYALGFAFLALFTSRIRTHVSALSLPDYVHQNYGHLAGHLVFLISFGAFFSMLLIQFTAGGQILQPLLNLDYSICVLIIALITTAYLVIGGFRTVLLTDMIQGISRLILMPLIIIAVISGVQGGLQSFSAETLPLMVWIGLTITGFFAAASSADVWQRIYAARDEKSASGGLLIGAAGMMIFGIMLALLGIIANEGGITTNADTAFVDALSSNLPTWAVYLAVILVLSTIMGTADTEIFLLAGMLGRELFRLRGIYDEKEIARRQFIRNNKILVAIIAACAVGFALVFRDLLTIYTWLLSAILIIAPMIIFSLFFKLKQWQVKWSMLINLTIFIILAILGLLSPENAYLIVIPGIILLSTMLWLHRKQTSL